MRAHPYVHVAHGAPRTATAKSVHNAARAANALRTQIHTNIAYFRLLQSVYLVQCVEFYSAINDSRSRVLPRDFVTFRAGKPRACKAYNIYCSNQDLSFEASVSYHMRGGALKPCTKGSCSRCRCSVDVQATALTPQAVVSLTTITYATSSCSLSSVCAFWSCPNAACVENRTTQAEHSSTRIMSFVLCLPSAPVIIYICIVCICICIRSPASFHVICLHHLICLSALSCALSHLFALSHLSISCDCLSHLPHMPAVSHLMCLICSSAL